MNELKPVARVIPDYSHGEGVTMIAQIVEQELPSGEGLYIIPDTHRVVSVELLRTARKVAAWPEHPAMKQIQAIIGDSADGK